MSKVSSASKIKVKSFDDLFSGANAEQNVPEQEIKRIPINLLHDFQHHPFKIKEDDRFYEMVDSIKKYGVLVPGLARPRAEGGYEIVAGHTRRMACLHAGVDDMPFIVKNYNDDEATIVMVDSNIQREDILVSEKARAYKMRYDAVKHQGKKGNTLNAMSEDTGENAKKIQRYIWLARLNDELLEMVDVKALGFSQGVAISFLNEDEQSWVLGAIRDSQSITAGLLHELDGVHGVGVGRSLREDVVFHTGQNTQLTFDGDAALVSQLDHFTGQLNVLLEGQMGAVDHNGGVAAVHSCQTCLDGLTVVQVQSNGNGAVLTVLLDSVGDVIRANLLVFQSAVGKVSPATHEGVGQVCTLQNGRRAEHLMNFNNSLGLADSIDIECTLIALSIKYRNISKSTFPKDIYKGLPPHFFVFTCAVVFSHSGSTSPNSAYNLFGIISVVCSLHIV